jgi:hypothetical protein
MTTTETTTQNLQFVDVSIKMRLATSEDFRKEELQINSNGQVETKIKPKLGQPYWLKSQIRNEFDNRNYQISEDTDWPEFKEFLRREMVYVPAGYFELKEAGEI